MQKMDVSSLDGPAGLLVISKTLRDLGPGDEVEVAVCAERRCEALPQFCNRHQHSLVSARETEGKLWYRIRKVFA